MFNFNKVLIALVIILLLVLGVVLYWQKIGFERPYWAVYLSTGDLYFGKLNRFPKLSLSDVWFLQRDSQNPQNPLSLSRFNDAFWGPTEKMYLNKETIIWKVKLKPDSQVLQFIKNPQTSNQNLQSQLPALESGPAPTSTSR